MPRRSASILPRVLTVLMALAIVGGLIYVTGRWAEHRALDMLQTQASNSAELNRALVRNGFERYRPLPFVLAQSVDVLRVLDKRLEKDILSLDESLESLSAGVGASAIYVLDSDGRAIAASNWREPATFVGVDYRFRPYFRDAMQRGESEHFALGTVSHLPGLYFSHRVQNGAGQPVGVVVVKVDFVQLESDWQHQRNPVFVTDENSVVLLTSEPRWRFQTYLPLSTGRAQALRDSLQFGDSDLRPMDLTPLDSNRDLIDGPSPADDNSHLSRPTPQANEQLPHSIYLHTQLPIATLPGWTLHSLSSVNPTVASARRNAQLSAALAAIIVLGLLGLAIRRRDRLRHESRRRKEMVNELEKDVAARTQQLEATHRRLASALEEKLTTQTRVQTLQDELAQANKLTLLGQVAAGVAHEINQPLAAIRSYTDNTAIFLQRGQSDAALKNLKTISGLTERVSKITRELKNFSRRGRSHQSSHTRVQDAIDGALLLLGASRDASTLAVRQIPSCTTLLARIDKIRLEQILVNLLQNARDALQGTPQPEIQITIDTYHRPAGPDSTGTQADMIRIAVQDNGAGLSDAIRERLFTPFATTKDEGLGLGLVICRDLAREAGGQLSVATDSGTTGARFVLELPVWSSTAESPGDSDHYADDRRDSHPHVADRPNANPHVGDQRDLNPQVGE